MPHFGIIWHHGMGEGIQDWVSSNGSNEGFWHSVFSSKKWEIMHIEVLHTCAQCKHTSTKRKKNDILVGGELWRCLHANTRWALVQYFEMDVVSFRAGAITESSSAVASLFSMLKKVISSIVAIRQLHINKPFESLVRTKNEEKMVSATCQVFWWY